MHFQFVFLWHLIDFSYYISMFGDYASVFSYQVNRSVTFYPKTHLVDMTLKLFTYSCRNIAAY
jgi:hypothetical protein